MTIFDCVTLTSLHDPSRRTVLSARRALGRSDRARHAAGSAVELPRPNSARGRRSNSATGRSATRELETMVETAASAFLRAGYGKDTSVALFLGNTPDHPVNFFGALKAGARIVHLSPLDGEIALSHKLVRFRRARARHQQPLRAVADRAEIPRQGPARPADRLRGRSLGQGRHAADGAAEQSRDHHLPAVHRRRRKAGAMARDRRRRRCAAAIYRRHHRPAEGRDAQPRQSDRGGVDLRRLGQAGARRARRRSSA